MLQQSLENFEGVDPFVGTTIDGKYQVLENVGQGGMSVVYKAMQTAMHRIVALKMLKMGLSSDPVFSQRFMREVSLLGKLNHPNIVTVFDSGMTSHGNLYLAMDFLSGPTLQEILDKTGALKLERAAPLILQICDALNHAHKRDIIHRDLKPGNIMIETDHRGDEVVKIVDFGLAKMGEGSERLTRAGELWGSSFYMSPEQCNGAESDWRSDIYSFGIVMYQMVTGKVPFRGSGFMETVTKQLNEPPPPLKLTKSDLVVPDMLERVMFKCLEKAPENRFQSVADLKSALQSVLPEAPKPEKDLTVRPPRPIGAPIPSKSTKTSKPKEASKGSHGKGLIVLLIVLVICSLAVFYVLNNHIHMIAPNAVAPSAVTPSAGTPSRPTPSASKESTGSGSASNASTNAPGHADAAKKPQAKSAAKSPHSDATKPAEPAAKKAPENAATKPSENAAAKAPHTKHHPRVNVGDGVWEPPVGSGKRRADAQDDVDRRQ